MKTRLNTPGQWLACVSMVSILTLGVANAHQQLIPHTHDTTYSQITDVEFVAPPQTWQTISTDRRTLTTRLPPSSTILDNSPELRASIQITTTIGGGITLDVHAVEPATEDDAFPDSARGKIQCGSGSQIPVSATCVANHIWAATLTNSVTIPLRVKQSHSSTVRNLTWTIVPTEPGPYVASLDTPNTIKGYTTTMRVTLTSNAPAGGTTVNWQLVPGDCFSQATNSVPYIPSGLNNFSVPEGGLWKDFSVISNSRCDSARLETWVERTDTSGGPYFVAMSFAVQDPPENKSQSATASKKSSKGKPKKIFKERKLQRIQ